jgi:hypothetical protein
MTCSQYATPEQLPNSSSLAARSRCGLRRRTVSLARFSLHRLGFHRSLTPFARRQALIADDAKRISDAGGICSGPSYQVVMVQRTPLLRWLAVSLYITAIVGAVVVPHEHHHHAGCGVCCAGPECVHGHSTCDHSHGHAGHEHGPASDPPPAPTDPECSVCRFLAQGAKLAEPPQVTHVEALCVPASLPIPVAPIHRDEFAPPVRGPPVA